MVKRLASATLWFIVVGWGLNFVTLLLGLSEVIGLIVAAIVALFLGVDPMHLLWPERVRVEEPGPARASATPRPVQTSA
jgi:hypothetical protein